jgi:acyl carrier protein
MSGETEVILELIRKWAAAHPLEVPSDTSRTFGDAGFNSLHSAELMFFLEAKLGIKLDETVIWDGITFDVLTQYLAERCRAAKRAIATVAQWQQYLGNTSLLQ